MDFVENKRQDNYATQMWSIKRKQLQHKLSCPSILACHPPSTRMCDYEATICPSLGRPVISANLVMTVRAPVGFGLQSSAAAWCGK